MVFDKTGTLTVGKPTVVSVPAGKWDTLILAAAVERHSEHPIGKAIVEEALKHTRDIPLAENVAVVPGLGVKGTVHGRTVLVGKAEFLRANGVPDSPGFEFNREVGADMQVYIAVDGQYEGTLQFQDELRPHAAEAVREIRMGLVRTVLLTGD